ncbi:pyridoxal phosphate-dependent decarboxylase family protein [Luteimicrobium sp. NPDC057192]|uniref:pyridoxal phosphate-dependent decarboxylase family protein n=1 Tax=Luteimicrobium sp. NPDC057192 TaxID=3346042 RepID=UPI00363C07EB
MSNPPAVPAETGAGLPAPEVLALLEGLRAQDPPTHGGRVLSYVYDPDDAALDELAARAVELFLPVNGLDPTTFRSVAAVERDLVALARGVLHGDDDVVGSVTSGGTESCLLAVKSARDVWRAADPVRAHARPRLVAPTTAHPAFHKAAAYLDLDLVSVPVDPATGTVDPDRLLAEVDDRTALVVVSAPSYPFGVLDPVERVAAGAAERGVPCHVDACLGGWVLPWWRGEDEDPLPAWDFAVPGVTSVSADLHKYGYAPKGASVVLYRGRERHRTQYFVTSAWPGYPVVNPTVLGSRGAGPMAAAWAITRTLGTHGLAALVARTRRATDAVVEGAAQVEGLSVVGRPDGPLVALATDEDVTEDRRVDPFLLIDAVRRRGFLLQAQPALVQGDGTVLPRTVHLTVTPVTERVADDLIGALRAGADEVRGLAPAAPDPALAQQVLAHGLPDDLAVVMATLEALPPEVKHPVLAEVLAAAIDPARG